jgi:hypothetical protein
MEKIECTIYDCEFDQYYKAILRDNIVYALDNEGREVPAKEYVCEHVDFGMVQFYIGHYSQTGDRENDDDCKWGYFMHSTGQVVIPPAYDYAYPFYGNWAKVEKDMKCGFIDYEGREIVKIIWDDTDSSLNRGLCWVRKGDKFGYIDHLGTVVINPQFEMAKDCQFVGESYEDRKYAAIVKKDGKYGFIDEKGEYIFKPSFEDARIFWSADYEQQKRYAPVKAFGKWGFIDSKGHFIVDFQFDDVGREGAFSTKEIMNKEKVSFGEERINFYAVNKDGQWGIIKSDLEVIMPEDGQNYVVYKERKIYIKNGWITNIRRINGK